MLSDLVLFVSLTSETRPALSALAIMYMVPVAEAGMVTETLPVLVVPTARAGTDLLVRRISLESHALVVER